MKLVYIYLFLILSFINISRQNILLRITDISGNNSYIFDEEGLSVTGNTTIEVIEKQNRLGIFEKKKTDIKPDGKLKHKGIIPYVYWDPENGQKKPKEGVYSIELTRTRTSPEPVFKFKYIVGGYMFDNEYLFIKNDKWRLLTNFVLNFKRDKRILINELGLYVYGELLEDFISNDSKGENYLEKYELNHDVLINDTRTKFIIEKGRNNNSEFIKRIPLLGAAIISIPEVNKNPELHNNAFYIIEIEHRYLVHIDIKNQKHSFLNKYEDIITMIFSFGNKEYYYQFEKTKLEKSFVEFMKVLKTKIQSRDQDVDVIVQREYPVEICKTQYKRENVSMKVGNGEEETDIELGNVFEKINKLRK
jgi:hypothetical protein